jgi:LacI family transcriptional regulator
LLGLVVSDIANAFFAQLAASIEDAVRPHGYLLAICNTNEDESIQSEHLLGLVSRGVDGLIVSPSGARGFEKLAEHKLPVVTIDRPLPQQKLPHVGTDNIEAGRIIGRHLRTLGYRRVLVVGPEVSHERVEGLRKSLGRFAKLDVRWINQGRIRQSAAAIVFDHINQSHRPDVIVGLTNDSTIGAIDAVATAGLVIPKDIGVTGIDDFSAATIVSPAITLVAQPIAAIARDHWHTPDPAWVPESSCMCDSRLCPMSHRTVFHPMGLKHWPSHR